MIGRLTQDLLRRHVAGCTKQSSRNSRTRGDSRGRGIVGFPTNWIDLQSRKSKIEDLQVPVIRHENVLRLDIAVNEPAIVRRRKSLRDLQAILDRDFWLVTVPRPTAFGETRHARVR